MLNNKGFLTLFDDQLNYWRILVHVHIYIPTYVPLVTYLTICHETKCIQTPEPDGTNKTVPPTYLKSFPKYLKQIPVVKFLLSFHWVLEFYITKTRCQTKGWYFSVAWYIKSTSYELEFTKRSQQLNFRPTRGKSWIMQSISNQVKNGFMVILTGPP